MLVAKQTPIKQETSLPMYTNQRASQVQQQPIRHYTKKHDPYTFIDSLNTPEYIDKTDALFPAHRARLFPPKLTLSMFMAQVLNEDRSCQKVVDETAVKQVLKGSPVCSTNTGAYCKARQRIPPALPSTLTRYTGQLLSANALSQWHWKSRPVRLVDGVMSSLPDTEANQAAYPQPGSQKPGLGFPLCRMVSIICLGSGAVLDMASGPCKGKGSDEQTLLRSMLDTLQPNDVLVGDAFYATYFLLCALKDKGVDGVFEQYGPRKLTTDFSKGELLGTRDHIITIQKSPKKPDWMEQDEYDRAPDTLRVRELKTGGKILVTTLLCPQKTHKVALGELYKDRWHIEMDFRNIKTTMGMETLSCRTPSMVEKEIWIYLLAYNLIRLLMAQSALLANITPRQISFKHAVQLWIAWQGWCGGQGSFSHPRLGELFTLIAQRQIGKRPGRIEPRALKRRSKPFPLLTKPRAEAREGIRKNGHPKKLK